MNKAKRRFFCTLGVLFVTAAGIYGCSGGSGSRWSTEESPGRESVAPVPDFTEPETESQAISLPAQYDRRSKNLVPPVKDQGRLGTCWAFASLTALESALLPEESWDFSEDHMSSRPGFRLTQEEGGEFTMSMAYLLSWQGPVREEDDPYGDGISPEGLEAVKHVQDIWLLPEKDLEQIKDAVYHYGGVQTSLYTTLKDKDSSSEYYNRSETAYYYPKEMPPNHDVVIIGWDDTFSKDRFYGEVPADGAFLCQNSWGPEFGDNGCFYVSYWDANIAKSNVLYATVEDTSVYDRIYQSDLCGWIGQLGYGGTTAWAVNVYQAADAEYLKAVGFYATGRNTTYEVYVVRQIPEGPQHSDFEDRILVADGTLNFAGFYTIPLDLEVALADGERFGVMIKLVTPQVIHPIAIEYDAGDGKSVVDLNDGEGYISQDGKQWQNVESEQQCNLCLKAYTAPSLERR